MAVDSRKLWQFKHLPLVNVSDETVQKIRAMKARVLSGTGRGLILNWSDSTGAGVGVAPVAQARAKSFPSYLAKGLSRLNIPAIAESIVGNMNQSGNYAQFDPRVTTGTWSYDGNRRVMGGFPFRSDAAGSEFTFTPGIPVDTFELAFLGVTANGDTINVGIGAGKAAPASIAIDGAAAVANATTINSNNATYRLRNALIKAAGLAQQSVSLTKVEAKAFTFYSIRAYNSQVPAIDIMNGAYPGSTTNDWNGDDIFNASKAVALYKPDLVQILLGINDWNSGVPLETYGANIRKLVDAAKATGADVLLIAGLQSNWTNTQTQVRATKEKQAEYVELLYQIAIEKKCLFMNFHTRYIDYPTAFANGWMNDDVHGKDVTYADQGNFTAEMIAAI